MGEIVFLAIAALAAMLTCPCCRDELKKQFTTQKRRRKNRCSDDDDDYRFDQDDESRDGWFSRFMFPQGDSEEEIKRKREEEERKRRREEEERKRKREEEERKREEEECKRKREEASKHEQVEVRLPEPVLVKKGSQSSQEESLKTPEYAHSNTSVRNGLEEPPQTKLQAFLGRTRGMISSSGSSVTIAVSDLSISSPDKCFVVAKELASKKPFSMDALDFVLKTYEPEKACEIFVINMEAGFALSYEALCYVIANWPKEQTNTLLSNLNEKTKSILRFIPESERIVLECA